MHDVLSTLANLASILTACVAAGAALWLWLQQRARRRALEQHLRAEKAKRVDDGQRSLLHLMRHLAMTEADILQAAFRSPRVIPRSKPDADGFAAALLFEYTGKI